MVDGVLSFFSPSVCATDAAISCMCVLSVSYESRNTTGSLYDH